MASACAPVPAHIGAVLDLAERGWRGEIPYQARAEEAEALMARGIFSEVARESAAKAGHPLPERGTGQRPMRQEEKR